MIKFILIASLIFLLIFLLIKFFKSPNLQIKHLFIFFIIGIAIYFIYTGKITYLFTFLSLFLFSKVAKDFPKNNASIKLRSFPTIPLISYSRNIVLLKV